MTAERKPSGAGNGAADLYAAASAPLVNRAHRVVRQRAKSIQERKRTMRSLLIPLLVCAGLMAVIVGAVWSVLGQDEAAPTGPPDAGQQMFVLLMWCLPVSLVLMTVIWTRRSGTRQGNGGAS